MKLIDHTRESLLDYIAAQCATVVPDGKTNAFRATADTHLDEALERLNRCINAVAVWRPDQFNVLHSSQHCTLLYYLANTIWRRSGETAAPTRLFLVNKAFNGIDLYFEIAMPEVFYIGHSVGIVLAKATYGNYLVLYQNVNVGRHKTDIPVIGERVILYPSSSVVGSSVVEDGSVLAQGTKVINKSVPTGSVAFAGEKGELVFKPAPDLMGEYFRI